MVFEDRPVKWLIYPAIIFMVLGMTFGVFIAFNGFLLPDYFSGEYIHFGRIRPVHVSHVLFLWLLSANLGLFYYFVPRLSGVPIWSLRLAAASIAIWWFTLILGVYSFPFGTNYGWEYDEFPMWLGWIPLKFLLIAAWALSTVNLFMTVANRRYEKMYVSIWYALGTMVWATTTFFLGTYFLNWVPGGISRVNVNFFYVHNLVGLIFTPMGLAAAYYFLPKIANVPIYSHRLSMIGFWSIAFVYAWVGAHHIIHGPVTQWLQTTAIMFSIWLLVPVWTVVFNLFATVKGDWKKYTESPAVRFILVGNVYYLMTSIQGSLQALRNVNEITSKTDWIIGHSHISLYGTFTFFALAGIYHVIPSITKKPLWSKTLAEWHFNLNLLASVPFLLALWIGGYWQGMLWASWGNGTTYAEYHTNLSDLSFVETVAEMHNYWVLRAVSGIVILFANLLFVVNIYNTIMLEPRESLAYGKDKDLEEAETV